MNSGLFDYQSASESTNIHAKPDLVSVQLDAPIGWTYWIHQCEGNRIQFIWIMYVWINRTGHLIRPTDLQKLRAQWSRCWTLAQKNFEVGTLKQPPKAGNLKTHNWTLNGPTFNLDLVCNPMFRRRFSNQTGMHREASQMRAAESAQRLLNALGTWNSSVGCL